MSLNFLKSKLFIAGGGVLLLLVAAYWGREVWHNYQIGREIRALQGEIDSLQSRSQELSSLITYFRTPEFKERQARELLGLQKPGEFVVALPADEDGSAAEGAAGQPAASRGNFVKWRHYFFGTK